MQQWKREVSGDSVTKHDLLKKQHGKAKLDSAKQELVKLDDDKRIYGWRALLSGTIISKSCGYFHQKKKKKKKKKKKQKQKKKNTQG
jgi:hypothetical protein